MDVTPILDPLNERQREAVTAEAKPTLILAGAGSGKTRVLVHRVAWLVEAEAVSPHAILAVTFTNKAAQEMKGRIEHLIGVPAGAMWVGTFHGICHRMLRMHHREAGLVEGFQILDSEDQQRLLKRVMRGLDIEEDRWGARELQWWINARKDEGLRSQHIDAGEDPTTQVYKRIYAAYEEACERAGLVDFAELLLRILETLRRDQELLAHYQRRFRHLLVDEFQDTNDIQYAWLRLLAGREGIPFVVGDDDQSIYRWRGARVENLQRFQKDFPSVRVVRLEQNYRSTANILGAANGLIAHNRGRMGKELWTDGEDGDAIQVYAAFNEQDEAQFVVDRIRRWVDDGNRRDEVAVLYRSNAQSRVFEEAFIASRVPYRVYGGLRFFERQEIKDALAYLRLVQNRDDDPSFERVVNTPTRGIGARTVELVRERARGQGLTLWSAAVAMLEELPSRASTALRAFLELIRNMDRDTTKLPLHERVEHVIHGSGLPQHFLHKEKGERGQARVENLEELVTAARSFEPEEPDDGSEPMPELAAFLAHAALEAGEAQGEAWEDCVQMMTLHSAKGLEFPLVFMAGMEDGLFPHQRSMADPEGLEEERRLCYVGMTRAEQQLYLSYAEQRRIYGSDTYPEPSRFLGEIPEDRMEEIRPRVSVSRPVPARMAVRRGLVQEAAPDGLKLGVTVRHAKFGDGTVINHEGQGAHARVQVNFEDAGIKWLVLQYANLEVIG